MGLDLDFAICESYYKRASQNVKAFSRIGRMLVSSQSANLQLANYTDFPQDVKEEISIIIILGVNKVGGRIPSVNPSIAFRIAHGEVYLYLHIPSRHQQVNHVLSG